MTETNMDLLVEKLAEEIAAKTEWKTRIDESRAKQIAGDFYKVMGDTNPQALTLFIKTAKEGRYVLGLNLHSDLGISSMGNNRFYEGVEEILGIKIDDEEIEGLGLRPHVDEVINVIVKYV